MKNSKIGHWGSQYCTDDGGFIPILRSYSGGCIGK